MSKKILNSMPLTDFINQINAICIKEAMTNVSIVDFKYLVKFKSRNETAKILKISVSTLSKYAKNGIIPSYSIGGRYRFNVNDILDAIPVIKRIKHKNGV